MKKLSRLIAAFLIAICGISCDGSAEWLCLNYPAELTESVSSGEVIDLGLSVKWCGRNLGAASVQDPGGLYTWQSTNNYKTKADSSIGFDDPATKLLGASYRCPTKSEFSELLSSCTCQFVTYKNRPGLYVKGPNGASIFLPCGGGLDKTTESWNETDFFGRYWSGTPDEGNPKETVWALYFSSQGTSLISNYPKINACCSIRAVYGN